MENANFLKYFDLPKDQIKLLLDETNILITEVEEVSNLEPENEDLRDFLVIEREKYRALKLALIANDTTSGLSTIDFNDHGTLDVNQVFDEINEEMKTPPRTPPRKAKFVFNFHKTLERSSLEKRLNP